MTNPSEHRDREALASIATDKLIEFARRRRSEAKTFVADGQDIADAILAYLAAQQEREKEGCSSDAAQNNRQEVAQDPSRAIRDEAKLEDVWATCPYLRGLEECKRCPRTETVNDHENCTRACFALAQEVVNIAQTGNAWRKPVSGSQRHLPTRAGDA